MRLVAWNCRDDFARKLGALLSLSPDVAVVSEVRRSAVSNLPPGTSAFWVGPEADKGLAVLGFGRWRVRACGDLHGNWFAPFEAKAPGLRLRGVGVWTETHPTDSYETIAVAAASEMLSGQTPMVVAGDFNLSEADDVNRLRGARMSALASLMEASGLRSAWHSRTAERFGAEDTKTYFHRCRADRGFHIDFVFLDGERLKAVKHMSAGSFDDWVASGLSDHCPLVLDIDDAALAVRSDA